MTTKPSYTPALRFPDFLNDGEWKVKRLGDLFVRITDRNKENNKNVLTISAQFGLVNQFEYFSKNVAASDVTNYYIIQKGDFAYNKSRSQGYPFGAIKPLLLYDRGVVSTLYICFRLKEDSGCDADFYRFYFETGIINDQISNIAQEGARNHGLLNISTEDFFNINLIVPPLPEQRRIAQALTALDELIAATNEKLEQMKAYKKGLMQQLFVDSMGGGKSLKINHLQIPKLRFPEFYQEKEWEEKKLGEVGTFVRGLSYSKNDVTKDCSSILVIRSNNIIQDGFVDYENGLQFVSKNPSSDQILQKGDIVVCLANGSSDLVGKSASFDGNYEGIATIGAFCGIYRSSAPITKYLVQTTAYKEKIDIIKQGGNGALANLYGKDILDIKLYFPSLPEQCKIASCLSTIDDQINAYTEKVGLLGQFKKGLMQQMFVN